MTVPAVINIYNSVIQKEMLVQEGEVKNAANIFLTDYCLDPIDGVSCPSTMVKQNYICLSDIQEGGVKYIIKEALNGGHLTMSELKVVRFKSLVDKNYVIE